MSLGVDPDDLIVDHGLGRVARSTTELSSAIREVLADDAAYDEMSRRCYELVSTRHSVTRSADMFLAALAARGGEAG